MYRCYLSLSGVTAKNKKLQESLRLAKRAQHLAKESKNKSMEADAVFQLGQVRIVIVSLYLFVYSSYAVIKNMFPNATGCLSQC